MSFMPIVIEKSGENERSYDLSSRMLKDRIITIDGEFNDTMAYLTKMQLQWLDSQSSEAITVYISSPGGSVLAGLGIKDIMENCRSDISIICTSLAASMGCYTLSTAGTPGKRFITKRSQVMCHQVSSSTQGVLSDQQISLRQSEKLNDLLMGEIAESVGVSIEQLLSDCSRDLWLNAEEALNYGTKGFVDGVLLGEQNLNGQYKVLYRDGKEGWI